MGMSISERALSALAGVAQIAGIGGDVMVCETYGRGKTRKLRCRRFDAGPGMPSMKTRKRVGVKKWATYTYSTDKAREATSRKATTGRKGGKRKGRKARRHR